MSNQETNGTLPKLTVKDWQRVLAYNDVLTAIDDGDASALEVSLGKYWDKFGTAPSMATGLVERLRERVGMMRDPSLVKNTAPIFQKFLEQYVPQAPTQ